MSRLVTIALTVLALLSCGKNNEISTTQHDHPPRPPFTPVPSHPILGKWVSSCAKVKEDEFRENGYEFRHDGSVTAYWINYSDALCSSELGTYALKGGFGLQNDIADVPKAKMIQIALSDPNLFVKFHNWNYMMTILIDVPFTVGAELHVEKVIPKLAEWFRPNITQPMEDSAAGSHEFLWEGKFLYRDDNIRTKKEAFTQCRQASKACVF